MYVFPVKSKIYTLFCIKCIDFYFSKAICVGLAQTTMQSRGPVFALFRFPKSQTKLKFLWKHNKALPFFIYDFFLLAVLKPSPSTKKKTKRIKMSYNKSESIFDLVCIGRHTACRIFSMVILKNGNDNYFNGPTSDGITYERIDCAEKLKLSQSFSQLFGSTSHQKIRTHKICGCPLG